MISSFSEQFIKIIINAKATTNAHLCKDDPKTAVLWDDSTQITIRLSLNEDEIFLYAGSGIFIRFVASSENLFDHFGIAKVIEQILTGQAIEYFGVKAKISDDFFATGYVVEAEPKFAGGLKEEEAYFRARLAGPMAKGFLSLE
jgi:hypothetical protein